MEVDPEEDDAGALSAEDRCLRLTGLCGELREPFLFRFFLSPGRASGLIPTVKTLPAAPTIREAGSAKQPSPQPMSAKVIPGARPIDPGIFPASCHRLLSVSSARNRRLSMIAGPPCHPLLPGRHEVVPPALSDPSATVFVRVPSAGTGTGCSQRQASIGSIQTAQK